jgi:sec-independent protein translocase protein TatA
MGLSWIHIVALAAVALLLFGGRGRIPELMGDVAKGIKSFRQGLSDPPEDPKTIGSGSTDKDKTAGQ